MVSMFLDDDDIQFCDVATLIIIVDYWEVFT